jgi:hypothetical protein
MIIRHIRDNKTGNVVTAAGYFTGHQEGIFMTFAFYSAGNEGNWLAPKAFHKKFGRILAQDRCSRELIGYAATIPYWAGLTTITDCVMAALKNLNDSYGNKKESRLPAWLGKFIKNYYRTKSDFDRRLVMGERVK